MNSFKFIGVHITEDLTWSTHTDAVLKKAHQRLFFLRRLRKFGMSPSIVRSFYSCTVESILTCSITRLVWKQHRWQTQNSGDLLFLQYKIKQVAHSAPRMLINSHGCLGFHSLCSFWLSPQPSPRIRVSTPSLSLSSPRSPVVFIRSLHANYCNQTQVFLILHLTHILTAVC